MFITDETFQIDWVIEKTATVYPQTYFDLQITKPSGGVSYFDNGAWMTSYTAPTVSTDGVMQLNYTPDEPGVYTLILGNGISTNFAIIDSIILLVIDQTILSTHKVILP